MVDTDRDQVSRNQHNQGGTYGKRSVTADVVSEQKVADKPCEIMQHRSRIPETFTQNERKIQVEIEKDSASALQQILTPAGGIRNSAAVEALRQANIETEKYILAARELEGTVLTKQQELAKRTEFQTEKLTDEIMKRLSNNPDYEPGTENYAAARETISDKVRAIIERQNRDLF